MPKTTVRVRYSTQNRADKSRQPTAQYKNRRSEFVDIKMVSQRVNYSEVLIDSDDKYTENRRCADEAGAGLSKVAESLLVVWSCCVFQDFFLEEFLAGFDDFDVVVRADDFFFDEDAFLDTFDGSVMVRDDVLG